MRALQYFLATLVYYFLDRANGFFGYDAYRDARNTYNEIITECEREGGECVSVDFGTTDPPPSPELPLAPSTYQPTYPPTRLVPIFVPYWHATSAPVRKTPWPRPVTYATYPVTIPTYPVTRPPSPSTILPRQTTKASPPVTTKSSLPKPKPKPRKSKPGKGRKKGRQMQAEYEPAERRKRAIWGPDPFDYLYSECPGGWEFNIGCSAKGKNVCCFPSSSGP